MRPVPGRRKPIVDRREYEPKGARVLLCIAGAVMLVIIAIIIVEVVCR
jgi:hypothetical protein